MACDLTRVGQAERCVVGVAEVETGFDQGGIPPDWRARDDKGVTAGQAVCRKWPGVAGRMPPAPRAARHRSNAIIQLERASCPHSER